MAENTSPNITRPELTPQSVADLYAAGMSVNDIAILYSDSYAKVRRLLRESGTPVRDASSRLKGRTRRSSKAEAEAENSDES